MNDYLHCLYQQIVLHYNVDFSFQKQQDKSQDLIL